jgi:hypothetical protein
MQRSSGCSTGIEPYAIGHMLSAVSFLLYLVTITELHGDWAGGHGTALGMGASSEIRNNW